MSNCCVCKKYLKVVEEVWLCEGCGGEHHPECSGDESTGIGEYPDEDSYSYCQKCVDKWNNQKVPDEKIVNMEDKDE